MGTLLKGLMILLVKVYGNRIVGLVKVELIVGASDKLLSWAIQDLEHIQSIYKRTIPRAQDKLVKVEIGLGMESLTKQSNQFLRNISEYCLKYLHIFERVIFSEQINFTVKITLLRCQPNHVITSMLSSGQVITPSVLDNVMVFYRRDENNQFDHSSG